MHALLQSCKTTFYQKAFDIFKPTRKSPKKGAVGQNNIINDGQRFFTEKLHLYDIYNARATCSQHWKAAGIIDVVSVEFSAKMTPTDNQETENERKQKGTKKNHKIRLSRRLLVLLFFLCSSDSECWTAFYW